MVLLTMTPAIVEALEKLQSKRSSPEDLSPNGPQVLEEPTLSSPSLGNPISHSQVLAISQQLRAQGHALYHLDMLLRSSRVYSPPTPPKSEPTPEYKALMSRLRREAESRAYHRLLDPSSGPDDLSSHLPASAAHAFSATAAYAPSVVKEEIMYSDVNRQVTLIFNVMISVFACAAAIWMAARWWDTPARLALSMSGSILVGIAEVVVYSGYLRRVGEAEAAEGKVREVKEVVRSWEVGYGEQDEDEDQKGKAREIVASNGNSNGGMARLVGHTIRETKGGARERKRRKENA